MHIKGPTVHIMHPLPLTVHSKNGLGTVLKPGLERFGARPRTVLELSTERFMLWSLNGSGTVQGTVPGASLNGSYYPPQRFLVPG